MNKPRVEHGRIGQSPAATHVGLASAQGCGGASRTARGSAWNSTKVHSLVLWQLTKIRFPNRTMCTTAFRPRPQRQCNPTYDNHGLQGSIMLIDYRRSTRSM